MSPIYWVYIYIRFLFESLCEFLVNAIRFTRLGRRRFKIKDNISDKVFVITGANTGIGKVTANELAKRGAKVIMGCRDLDKGNDAVRDIIRNNPESVIRIRLIELDLSSLQSVRRFARQVSQEENRVDVLINNAGVMMCPKWKTDDGFEMQFGTNHLGHFLLTHLLVDQLKASPAARVVTVSSLFHMVGYIHFDDINLDKNYSPYFSYAQSKVANVLFTRELARRLAPTNIKAYCLHPGIIRTELMRHVFDNSILKMISAFFQLIFYMDAYMGAQTTLYCALDESVAEESGYYYSNCRRVKCMTKNAIDDESAAKLWTLSCDLVHV